jgi:glutathione S-transferase
MDLYILPMAGSFTVHVACLEVGIAPTLHVVDRKTKRLDDGRDYLAINDSGTVPAISLPDGGVLSESVAILQYLADKHPELAPSDRYRTMEWLNFITTEVHKKHAWVLFSQKTTPEMKEWARASWPAVLEVVARRLEGKSFAMDERFTIVDAYLFWVLFIAPHAGVSLDRWPALTSYVERLRQRPSIQKAFAIEGPLYVKEQKAA